MACLSRHAACLMTAIAFALAAGNALGEPLFSFAATPGRLPKTVVPTHYAIDLRLDLDAATIAGFEVIDIEVKEPTDRLVLNALNMSVESATLDGEAGQVGEIALDQSAELLTLTFPKTIPAGPHKLRMAFTARINTFGRGLFSIDYPTAQGRKRMIATQLEPADARRIFPSWDEPAFKATFELTATLPATFLGVSNMPIVSKEPAGNGRKRVRFGRTPKMSTYLFVLVAGELEQLSGEAEGVAINVITTAGKSGQGRFALASAVELLKYFNDYFGVKYPLPKLDLIALPGGIGGAMENWGAITFFESRLLFDPATNSPEARRGIFIVLAHEMAHQWFGNLVTMGWWDNLWLNEGFATWMQAKAAQHIYPQWQTWLNSGGQRQNAMNDDARRTSRPIQQPVANETEAQSVFDSITYNKGQAFIRMLESYLGKDAFRAGIRRYMADHAYGSTTTANLWQALEAASGKPVAVIASTFTEQAGLPVVIGELVCVGERQSLRLRQERFSLHDPAAAPRTWQVPVVAGPLRALRRPEAILLRDQPMEIAAGRCGEPLKVNLGDVGYYRVQYDAAARAALLKSFAQMAPADRVNLLADSWALVEAGRLAPADLFALIEAAADDTTRAVWDQVIRILTRIDHLQRNRPERAAFQAYARGRLRPAFERIGWDRKPYKPAGDGLLRIRLIGALGDLGDQDVLAEAKRRFTRFLQDPNSLRPGLRDAVVRLAGRTADRPTYDALLRLARQATDAGERVRYYTAAASAADPDLARETLAITLTDELPTTLVGSLIFTVAWSGERPEVALEFVRSNFDALAAKQGPNFRNYFVSNLMTVFDDTARAAELAAFMPVHATSGGRIVAERAQAAILAGADFRARMLPAVDDWVTRPPRQP
jgi:aminopeptidase N